MLTQNAYGLWLIATVTLWCVSKVEYETWCIFHSGFGIELHFFCWLGTLYRLKLKDAHQDRMKNRTVSNINPFSCIFLIHLLPTVLIDVVFALWIKLLLRWNSDANISVPSLLTLPFMLLWLPPEHTAFVLTSSVVNKTTYPTLTSSAVFMPSSRLCNQNVS